MTDSKQEQDWPHLKRVLALVEDELRAQEREVWRLRWSINRLRKMARMEPLYELTEPQPEAKP